MQKEETNTILCIFKPLSKQTMLFNICQRFNKNDSNNKKKLTMCSNLYSKASRDLSAKIIDIKNRCMRDAFVVLFTFWWTKTLTSNAYIFFNIRFLTFFNNVHKNLVYSCFIKWKKISYCAQKKPEIYEICLSE